MAMPIGPPGEPIAPLRVALSHAATPPAMLTLRIFPKRAQSLVDTRLTVPKADPTITPSTMPLPLPKNGWLIHNESYYHTLWYTIQFSKVFGKFQGSSLLFCFP